MRLEIPFTAAFGAASIVCTLLALFSGLHTTTLANVEIIRFNTNEVYTSGFALVNISTSFYEEHKNGTWVSANSSSTDLIGVPSGIYDWYSIHYLSTCKGYHGNTDPSNCTRRSVGYAFSLKQLMLEDLNITEAVIKVFGPYDPKTAHENFWLDNILNTTEIWRNSDAVGFSLMPSFVLLVLGFLFSLVTMVDLPLSFLVARRLDWRIATIPPALAFIFLLAGSADICSLRDMSGGTYMSAFTIAQSPLLTSPNFMVLVLLATVCMLLVTLTPFVVHRADKNGKTTTSKEAQEKRTTYVPLSDTVSQRSTGEGETAYGDLGRDWAERSSIVSEQGRERSL